MMSTHVWLILILTLSSTLSNGQIIFADHDHVLVSDKKVYEILQTFLLNYISTDGGQKWTLKGENRPISSESDESMSVRLNERVSRLEDKVQKISEIMSSKENSETEFFERKSKSLSQFMADFESRMTSKHEEAKSLTNVSKRLSNDMRELQITLNESESKIEFRQQNLSQRMENLSSTMNARFHDNNILTNEKIKNMSANTDDLKITLENIQLKIADMTNSISNWCLSTGNKTKDSLNDIKLELVSYKQNVKETLEKRLNETVWMLEQNCTSVSIEFHSSLENVTNVIESIKENFDREGSQINTTLLLLEEKVQILEHKNIKLTDELNRSKMETASIKQDMSETIDKGLSDFNSWLNTETADIKGLVRDVVQNVSLLNEYPILHLELENNLNKSLTNVLEEVNVYKRESDERSAETVKKCVEMAKQLEMSIDKKVILYVDNMTTSINLTNNLVDLQGSKFNQSLISIEEKVKSLQSDKSVLEVSIAEAKEELSAIKRNETIRSTNLQFRIKEIASNMSSVAKDLQTEQVNFAVGITRNVSELNKNQVLLLNSLSNKTSVMMLHVLDLTRNMSLLEKELEAKFQTQFLTMISNFTSKIKESEDIFLQFWKQQQETNNTIGHILEEMDVIFEDINKKLNKTNLAMIHTRSQIEIYNRTLNNNSLNLTNIVEELFSDIMETVAANISSINDSLYRSVSIVENDVTVKALQVSLRLDQLSGNISSMFRNINRLESSNTGHSSRLLSLDTRLSNVSAALAKIRSSLENRSSITGVVRLVNGGSTYGRVELFYNEVWGTVCDDGWDNNDAQVVCRMLGLRGGTAKVKAAYGQGSGNIWLDDVACGGSELSIFTCTHPPVGQHNCNHGEDAGVICSG